MSLNPVKPIANTDAYEIMELVKGSGHLYRVRKKYSPVVAKEISSALVQTGRAEIAKELGISLSSEAGMSITDEQGREWYLFNAFYKDFEDQEVVQIPELDEEGEIKLDGKGLIVWKDKLDKDGKVVTTPKIKSRPDTPTPIVKCALRTICEPIGNAPDLMPIFPDIDEEALGQVMYFFILCRLKPEPTPTTNQPSTPPSENDGVVDTSTSPAASNTTQEPNPI